MLQLMVTNETMCMYYNLHYFYNIIIIIIIITIIIISLFHEDNILSMSLSYIWSST